jgi:hypothetical protein
MLAEFSVMPFSRSRADMVCGNYGWESGGSDQVFLMCPARERLPCLGISQEELAERAGLITKFENGVALGNRVVGQKSGSRLHSRASQKKVSFSQVMNSVPRPIGRK